jgi:hypothetical protein
VLAPRRVRVDDNSSVEGRWVPGPITGSSVTSCRGWFMTLAWRGAVVGVVALSMLALAMTLPLP